MRRLLALAVLLFASGARGQSGPPSYADRAGGPASDTGAAVAADEEGNVVMVGTLDGTGSFGSLSLTADETGCVFSTCHDAYVVMYAADGTALWARRMGTPVHNDFASGVAIVPEQFMGSDAAVLVSGYFTGVATWDGGANPDIELTTRSDFDAFLARYSASGDLEWVIQAGGTDQDTGRGVATDSDGNAYWTGSFRGTATFGSGDDEVVLTSGGSSDGFVARISTSGTLDWLLQIGGADGADAYDVAVDADYSDPAQVVVTGTFGGVAIIGESPLQSRGDSDGYIARLDPDDGSVQWVAQVGGSGDDHLRGVTIVVTHFEPAVVAAGWYSSQVLVGTDVLTSAGATDVLVVSYDLDGNVLWGRGGGGAGFDLANDVHGVPLQPIPVRGGRPDTSPALVTGYVDGTALFTDTRGNAMTLNAQGRDAFLAAYSVSEFPDTRGDLRAAIPLGGSGNDSGNGVSATPSYNAHPPGNDSGNGVYAVVAGTFQGTATAFGETIQSAGSSDAFVAKTTTCPGMFCLPTAEEPSPEASGVRLSVAPHPATRASTLTLALDTPLAVRVDLFDARGRRIAMLAEGPRALGEHRLALPPLAPGTYLIRATTAEGALSRAVTLSR